MPLMRRDHALMRVDHALLSRQIVRTFFGLLLTLPCSCPSAISWFEVSDSWLVHTPSFSVFALVDSLYIRHISRHKRVHLDIWKMIVFEKIPQFCFAVSSYARMILFRTAWFEFISLPCLARTRQNIFGFLAGLWFHQKTAISIGSLEAGFSSGLVSSSGLP